MFKEGDKVYCGKFNVFAVIDEIYEDDEGNTRYWLRWDGSPAWAWVHDSASEDEIVPAN